MTKKEMIDFVAKEAEVSKKEAEVAIEAVFNSIEKALKAKHPVTVPGFGTFKTSHRKARTGRNPQSGKTIKIAARTAVVFKPSKTLKDKFAKVK